eukprot:gnl/Dysnectes_brevis/891_a986_3535.p1 GENE.gnl/Dysnectes_brevis/891_a986_3535~~gnl/Dysnectes_brevis/891_a986_3535.p1  ORF type:complete len:275 (-),score=85.88 gnl/Dysnectes_brevis/891_a986_3535:31-855(-)
MNSIIEDKIQSAEEIIVDVKDFISSTRSLQPVMALSIWSYGIIPFFWAFSKRRTSRFITWFIYPLVFIVPWILVRLNPNDITLPIWLLSISLVAFPVWSLAIRLARKGGFLRSFIALVCAVAAFFTPTIPLSAHLGIWGEHSLPLADPRSMLPQQAPTRLGTVIMVSLSALSFLRHQGWLALLLAALVAPFRTPDGTTALYEIQETLSEDGEEEEEREDTPEPEFETENISDIMKSSEYLSSLPTGRKDMDYSQYSARVRTGIREDVAATPTHK